ncbi:MAG: hypothetical protein DSY35_02170, partial [Desulfurobacterium sp.]
MKLLNLLIKLKKRELREEEKTLSRLLKTLEDLEEKRSSLLRALRETSDLKLQDANLLSYKNSYQHYLLKEIEVVEKEMENLKE